MQARGRSIDAPTFPIDDYTYDLGQGLVDNLNTQTPIRPNEMLPYTDMRIQTVGQESDSGSGRYHTPTHSSEETNPGVEKNDVARALAGSYYQYKIGGSQDQQNGRPKITNSKPCQQKANFVSTPLPMFNLGQTQARSVYKTNRCDNLSTLPRINEQYSAELIHDKSNIQATHIQGVRTSPGVTDTNAAAAKKPVGANAVCAGNPAHEPATVPVVVVNLPTPQDVTKTAGATTNQATSNVTVMRNIGSNSVTAQVANKYKSQANMEGNNLYRTKDTSFAVKLMAELTKLQNDRRKDQDLVSRMQTAAEKAIEDAKRLGMENQRALHEKRYMAVTISQMMYNVQTGDVRKTIGEPGIEST